MQLCPSPARPGQRPGRARPQGSGLTRLPDPSRWRCAVDSAFERQADGVGVPGPTETETVNRGGAAPRRGDPPGAPLSLPVRPGWGAAPLRGRWLAWPVAWTRLRSGRRVAGGLDSSSQRPERQCR